MNDIKLSSSNEMNKEALKNSEHEVIRKYLGKKSFERCLINIVNLYIQSENEN